MRRLIAAVVVSLALAGCGSGYGGENVGIAGQLPKVTGAKLVRKSVHDYCSQHTCMFGNDRSSLGFEFSVDTSSLTQQQVIDVYTSALEGWTPMVDRCANADPSFCDGLMSVVFERGSARISLSFLNWPNGRFGVGVDARGR